MEQLGFSGIDALHLACAESAAADVILTTDDRLLRLSTRHAALLRVTVANPLGWLQDTGLI
jgi:predicted nucleic acid-binding protein